MVIVSMPTRHPTPDEHQTRTDESWSKAENVVISSYRCSGDETTSGAARRANDAPWPCTDTNRRLVIRRQVELKGLEPLAGRSNRAWLSDYKPFRVFTKRSMLHLT